MIKKIRACDLRPGMFVHDLNSTHAYHPLLQTQFKINSSNDINRLIDRGISSVYIDTTLGIDAPDAPTLAEVRRDIDDALLAIAQQNAIANPSPLPIPETEIKFAQQIYDEANQTVRELMGSMRLGRNVELEKAQPAVQGIVDSVFRNTSPLLQLGTIRTTNHYLFYHSVATCSLLSAFSRQLGIGRDVTKQIAVGAMLHDIGKTRIPEAILDKPGRLTESEFEEMKRHVEYGMEILADATWLPPVSLQVISQHHERYGGGGYPYGLKGKEISQFGQMAAIVDVYDAITSTRIYHAAMEPVEAIRKLHEWSEQHFNIELVEHFICCVGIYPVGTLVRLESGLLGVVIRHNPADLLKPVVKVIYDPDRLRHISPYELDLSAQSADRITGYEAASTWEIESNNPTLNTN